MGIDKNLVCRCCGEHVEYAEELQACAACESLFCGECITWCCEKEDEANGDYFCLTCAFNGGDN